MPRGNWPVAEVRSISAWIAAIIVAAVFLFIPPAAWAAPMVTVCASGCDQTTIAGAIAAVDADGTIEVAAGTYTEHDILVDKNLTIAGDPNSPPIIQAAASAHQGAGRVFQVNGGVTAAFKDLIIRHGDFTDSPARGGGIYNLGDLTFIRVTVANNRAIGETNTYARGGGIYSEGALILSQSTVQGNLAKGGEHEAYPGMGQGGGIASYSGDLTLNESSIIGNTAQVGDCTDGSCDSVATSGGGVYLVYATLTATGSSLNNNTADTPGRGGGIYAVDSDVISMTGCTISGNSAVGGDGGGLYIYPQNYNTPEFPLMNCTISGNSAKRGGGLYCYILLPNTEDLTLRLDNCTIFENTADTYGGGWYTDHDNGVFDAQFKNCVIHGNTAGTSGDNCYCESGDTFVSQGYNLLEIGTSCDYTGPGDLAVYEAKLGALADNGGPTMTHAPDSDSLAVNLADSTDIDGADVNLDQRGEARPQGAGNDIGAHELSAEPFKTLTITKDDPAAGLVTADKGNLHCGVSCQKSYAHGTLVTLTATPVGSNTFLGWSGGGCTGTDPCTVTMDQAVSVEARFLSSAQSIGPSTALPLLLDE